MSDGHIDLQNRSNAQVLKTLPYENKHIVYKILVSKCCHTTSCSDV